MEIINIDSKEGIEKLVAVSAPTWEGLDLDSLKTEGKSALQKDFGWNGKKAYVIRGSVMNKAYRLTGDNAYPDDLNIVSLDWNDFENFGSKYIQLRSYGIRWMDDIVDNNNARERRW